MKKLLLASMAALAAVTVCAQENDFTPKNYIYPNFEGEFSYSSVVTTGANIATPAFNGAGGLDQWNDGLVAVAGGQFANPNQPYFTDLKAGTSIIDLGGEVGKVFCVAGQNTDFAEKLQSIYNLSETPQLAKCTGGLNWFNINWFSDPRNTPTKSDYKRITCRITLNVYSNSLSANAVINKLYLVNDDGGLQPAGCSGEWPVNKDEFIKYLDDDLEMAIPETDGDGKNIWEPNRWMVLNIESVCPDNDGDKSYGPMRLKMEINQGNMQDCAILIRSVQWISDNEAEPTNQRDRSYTYFTPSPSVDLSGIQNVTVENPNAPVEYYNLQGVKVANPENGLYIKKQGNKATKVLVK